ncbi:hypothetical protein [Aporhodopirellula aestuarii]|uniref:Uncharacterized protein n=1 Tax=Aporhodopirellula aestuarii TaxID=2950107 RepID=A0ABT0U878_9BACT|nr:hypothetical protein [Aporhodopirellula aestuarii]MCM2373081.1 hypothetical protein [Aporhodopirellula aestuarii]
MKIFQLQPAFTIEVPLDQREAIKRLKSAIASEELCGFAESAGTVFDFKIDRPDRRFWSPHLSIQFSETESGTQLFARFSPRPEVWTMFIAIYFVVAILMCLAMIAGYVQWALGYTPWSLAAVPIGLLIISCLHVASMIGQGLSADQMTLLRGRLERAVEMAFGKEKTSLNP